MLFMFFPTLLPSSAAMPRVRGISSPADFFTWLSLRTPLPPDPLTSAAWPRHPYNCPYLARARTRARARDQFRVNLFHAPDPLAAQQNAKSRLHVLETQLRDLTWEHEVLEQRFHHVEKERDELYEKFESAIYDVQQKSGFKNILLERKLQTINESLEKKESQLSEVIHAANLDPNLLGTVSKKLDDVLDAKNGAIKDLQYELARVTKAHNDVIRVYESKLTEFGIPVEELGFRPLVTSTGTGPAGLVVS